MWRRGEEATAHPTRRFLLSHPSADHVHLELLRKVPHHIHPPLTSKRRAGEHDGLELPVHEVEHDEGGVALLRLLRKGMPPQPLRALRGKTKGCGASRPPSPESVRGPLQK